MFCFSSKEEVDGNPGVVQILVFGSPGAKNLFNETMQFRKSLHGKGFYNVFASDTAAGAALKIRGIQIESGKWLGYLLCGVTGISIPVTTGFTASADEALRSVLNYMHSNIGARSRFFPVSSAAKQTLAKSHTRKYVFSSESARGLHESEMQSRMDQLHLRPDAAINDNTTGNMFKLETAKYADGEYYFTVKCGYTGETLIVTPPQYTSASIAMDKAIQRIIFLCRCELEALIKNIIPLEKMD